MKFITDANGDAINAENVLCVFKKDNADGVEVCVAFPNDKFDTLAIFKDGSHEKSLFQAQNYIDDLVHKLNGGIQYDPID